MFTFPLYDNKLTEATLSTVLHFCVKYVYLNLARRDRMSHRLYFVLWLMQSVWDIIILTYFLLSSLLTVSEKCSVSFIKSHFKLGLFCIYRVVNKSTSTCQKRSDVIKGAFHKSYFLTSVTLGKCWGKRDSCLHMITEMQNKSYSITSSANWELWDLVLYHISVFYWCLRLHRYIQIHN